MPHKDPEERRAYKQAYHEKNRERHLARMKVWYANNREGVRAYQNARLEARRREDPEGLKRYQRNHGIKFRYGLSEHERLALFESSDGLCALCLEAPATHIDHDHETGRVRGALCLLCNQGLGHVERMGATSPAIEEYLATDWRESA